MNQAGGSVGGGQAGLESADQPNQTVLTASISPLPPSAAEKKRRVGRASTIRIISLLLVMGTAGRSIAGPFPQHLRDTGLFADGTQTRMAPGVLPYSPQYPLWSDGAAKRRWIQIPRGTTIDARDPDSWVFPVGTRVWKEFGAERPRETRLIVRAASGWLYATYRWTTDGADAVLVPEGGAVEVDPSWPGGQYVFPSRLDCLSCHEGRSTPILGFSALQLSPDRDPAAVHGEAAIPDGLDLATLTRRRLIRGLPRDWAAHPPRIVASTEVERAALGYLHGNCGQCHNARGPLAGLGLDLWHDPRRERSDEPGLATTVLRPSSFRIPGQPAAQTARVWPGAPERSALLARMSARHTAAQMPPLATQVVDTQAMQLIIQWIDQPPVPTHHPVPNHAVQTRSSR